jgi:hypothetical protein
MNALMYGQGGSLDELFTASNEVANVWPDATVNAL